MNRIEEKWVLTKHVVKLTVSSTKKMLTSNYIAPQGNGKILSWQIPFSMFFCILDSFPKNNVSPEKVFTTSDLKSQFVLGLNFWDASI